jgi:cytochrome P450
MPKYDRYREFELRRALTGDELNLTSADAARSLFLKQTQARYRPLVAAVNAALGRAVMIVADGEEWRKTHDAVMPHLQAALVAREYPPVIRSAAEEAFAKLAASSAPGEESSVVTVSVEPLMRTIVARVMGQLLFGRALPVDEGSFLEDVLSCGFQAVDKGAAAKLNRLTAVLMRALRLPQWQPFIFPRAQRRSIDELIAWIEDKLDQGEAGANLPPLYQSLKERFSSAEPQRRRRLIATEYAMLLTAGVETTAAAVTFAVAEIAGSPSILEKVTLEARGNAPPRLDSGAPGAQFPYLHCVVQETLRRHTVVPTMLREAEFDLELSGRKQDARADENVKVRRGCVLRYLPLRSHLRRGVWRNPLQFDPDRFAGTLTAEQAKSFTPFGMGTQSCPGRPLAMIEAVLILQAFFERLDVQPKKSEGFASVTRSLLFTMRPIGVTVGVRARTASASG